MSLSRITLHIPSYCGSQNINLNSKKLYHPPVLSKSPKKLQNPEDLQELKFQSEKSEKYEWCSKKCDYKFQGQFIGAMFGGDLHRTWAGESTGQATTHDFSTSCTLFYKILKFSRNLRFSELLLLVPSKTKGFSLDLYSFPPAEIRWNWSFCDFVSFSHFLWIYRRVSQNWWVI